MDNRSSYTKVVKMIKELQTFYQDGEKIPSGDIEYVITSMLGYADNRTINKFFEIAENFFFLERVPKARPITRHKTFMKRNLKSGTATAYELSGDRYCWSAYVFGARAPKRRIVLSPVPSLSSYELKECSSENICVRDMHACKSNSSVKLPENVIVGALRKDGEEKKSIEEELYLSSIVTHTHIVNSVIVEEQKKTETKPSERYKLECRKKGVDPDLLTLQTLLIEERKEPDV